MPDSKLVMFGNPTKGAAVMLAAPLAALDLPLRVLVWDDGNGVVSVSFYSPGVIAERLDIEGGPSAIGGHPRCPIHSRRSTSCGSIMVCSSTTLRSRSPTMKPCIHVITLAVADLDRALAFYRDGLGFHTEGLIGTQFKGDESTPDGTTAVFQLDGGLMLSIYPRSELAKDAALSLTPANPGELSIGHVVASRLEVDEVVSHAQAAGAAVTVPPHDRPWGIYSGYFQDPDGHLWEIIWNPALDLATT